MKAWVMRVVGSLNLLFGVGGLYYFAVRLSWRWHDWPGSPSLGAWFAFAVLSTLTTSLVCSLSYFGIRLLIGDESAIRKTAVVFGAEILYFLTDVIVFWLILPMHNPQLTEITAGFFGIASGPLDPQVATGYPLFGLAAMLLLMKTKRTPSDKHADLPSRGLH